MESIDTGIFKEFEKYMLDNKYTINVIDEMSIRGIKDTFIVHFYYDWKYYQFVIYVSDNGYKLYATMFLQIENGYQLNFDNDKRVFGDLKDILQFTSSEINRDI